MHNEIEKTMFGLIQSAIFGYNIELPDSIDWLKVYQEMKNQTVSCIPADRIIKNERIGNHIKGIWMHDLISQSVTWTRILYAQNELIQLLNKHEIKMAIIKGTAAAIYYPRPEFRTMGDIDFLVSAKDFQKAYHILLKNGYRLAYDEDNVNYHISLEKGGILFEIHNKPAGLPNGSHGEHLRSIIDNGLDNVDYKQLEGHEIPVLPRLQNGVVLLLHIIKHLNGGLGLRQILDWMLFVNINLDDDVWENEFLQTLREARLVNLSMIVTKMCQKYLGLRTSNITWCNSINDKWCDELMNYILEQGNFGIKKGENEKGLKALIRIENIIDLFKCLQQKGRKNWELAKKVQILYHFAWVYEIVKYIKFIICRKQPLKALINDILLRRKRKRFFKFIKS